MTDGRAGSWVQGIEIETLVAFVGLAWLVIGVLLMMRSVRRGRDLAERFASRHPDEYEAMGRPLPGYFASVRGNRFAMFVARREFESLDDAPLAAEFEAYKRVEARLIITILASGAVVGALALVVRYAA